MKRPGLAVGGLVVALLALGGVSHFLGESAVFWPGYLAMAAFYGVMFYIGLAAARGEDRDAGELLLAGRSLPLGTALLTMTATWVGGGFINGTAESVAASGIAWTQAPWGYALSLVVGGLVFAKPMRRRNYTTMLDPLADRFGAKMSALLYLPALLGEIFWTAAILTALGTTFGYLLDLSFDLAIVVSAGVAIIYTSLGGLRSVAHTDVFQLAILLGGLSLAVPFVLPSGGLGQLWGDYRTAFPENYRPWPERSWGDSFFLWWDYALLLVFGGIPWHVYFQRVLSSRSAETAQRLSLGAGGLCLVAALPAVVFGMVAATTDWSAQGLSGPENSAISLPYVLHHLAPTWVAILGLGALAAAVMSSVDSSILSASSMGAWNVYRPWAGERRAGSLHKVIRRLIWIVGIAATLLALQIKSVYALWFLCSDLVYCILFAQLVTALFDKKANAWGSLAGFVVALTLRLGGGEPALGIPRWIAYPMVDEAGTVNFPFRTTSMLAGLLTIMVVSRLTGGLKSPRPLRTRSLS